MMRYRDLTEMILLGLFLATIGAITVYAAPWRSLWGRIGATPRVVMRTLVIVAGVGACFALGRILFNWY